MGTNVSRCLGVEELGTRSGRLAQWPRIRRIPILEPTRRPTNQQTTEVGDLSENSSRRTRVRLAIAILTASLGSSNLRLKL